MEEVENTLSVDKTREDELAPEDNVTVDQVESDNVDKKEIEEKPEVDNSQTGSTKDPIVETETKPRTTKQEAKKNQLSNIDDTIYLNHFSCPLVTCIDNNQPLPRIDVRQKTPYFTLEGKKTYRPPLTYYEEIDGSFQESLMCDEVSVIAVDTLFKGVITVGPKTVIHPSVFINAAEGCVEIGEGCVFEEQSVICSPPGGMKIGNFNFFQIGTSIKNVKTIGDYNDFGIKCKIDNAEGIGNGNVFGAGVCVNSRIIYNECTVFGPLATVSKHSEEQIKAFALNLKTLLPTVSLHIRNNHYIRRGLNQADDPPGTASFVSAVEI